MKSPPESPVATWWRTMCLTGADAQQSTTGKGVTHWICDALGISDDAVVGYLQDAARLVVDERPSVEQVSALAASFGKRSWQQTQPRRRSPVSSCSRIRMRLRETTPRILTIFEVGITETVQSRVRCWRGSRPAAGGGTASVSGGSSTGRSARRWCVWSGWPATAFDVPAPARPG